MFLFNTHKYLRYFICDLELTSPRGLAYLCGSFVGKLAFHGGKNIFCSGDRGEKRLSEKGARHKHTLRKKQLEEKTKVNVRLQGRGDNPLTKSVEKFL